MAKEQAMETGNQTTEAAEQALEEKNQTVETAGPENHFLRKGRIVQDL